MMKRATVTLLTAACTMGISACGNDPASRAQRTSPAAAETTPASPGSAGSSAPSSADERAWAGRVSAVCRRNTRAMRTLAQDVARETGETDRNQLTAAVLERAIPKEKAFMAELRDIEAPAALDADWNGFLDGIDRALAMFPRLVEIARENRSDSEFTTEMVKIAAETRPFAQSHDLLACLPDAN